MLSGEKSLEEKRWVEGKRRGACDYSAVSSVDNFYFLECQRRRGTSQEREAHVRSRGGGKICIGTEKERFPGRASEGKSNRAEYPMTNVQLWTEVLG